MNEKDFFEVFNDIDDKFVDEEQQAYSPLLPVETKAAVRSFSWGRIAAAVFACFIVTAGFIAVGGYAKYGGFGGSFTTAPIPTATDETTFSDITSVNSSENEDYITTDSSGNIPRDQQKVLFQSKLCANLKTYDVTVLLCRENHTGVSYDIEQQFPNYIWGDIAIELSLNGEVQDTIYPYEACYGAGGVPFDKERLGSDYFKVFSMKRDVLAYFTPNQMFFCDKIINGSLLNARFFTVNEEGKLVNLVRYTTEEERDRLSKLPDGSLTTPDATYFKITSDYKADSSGLVYFLSETIKNPWVDNNTVFAKGSLVGLNFDFENYRIWCDTEKYKYLVYHLTTDPADDYPEIPLIDGSLASYQDILSFDTGRQSGSALYCIDGCYAVPSFTPAEDRVAGEKGAWIKLKEGSVIGNFIVEGASSDYFPNDSANFFPDKYLCSVLLKGNLNCTATATKEYDPKKHYSYIKLTLDKESCEQLFSLVPKIKVLDEQFNGTFEQDFEHESITIKLTNDMNGYYDIYHLMDNSDSAKVRVTTKHFSLEYYFESGQAYDNNTSLRFSNENYKIEAAE